MHVWVQQLVGSAAVTEVHVLGMCSQLSADSLQSTGDLTGVCLAAAASAAGATGGTPGALAAAASVEVPPAVPEVQEPGTCSLLDADVAPHWPAKPGVYVRGAFTRQMGAQQLARMSGGTRCVSEDTQLAC